ncbi:GNAT family N-acetyltransferase [Roseovarius rhodophyticola]|uniref:GNAT family N-acetyltransferase n=1 Tax=Roseovarius rhodophyticola TaxID=3080827 RepID=A0ABZ2TBS0_9RHOB|nr:GNAT family N-acetyltransferase [Roseovarius sp. W115]MDV2930871.1 GNAT family N-acetyltransferase [Roseovarius sp. W115]
MTPQVAQIWQVPSLLRILWAHHQSDGLRDVWVMLKVTARGWVRVIEDAKGPVGFAMRDDARLHALYVHPRGQGAGVGRALLMDAQSDTSAIDLWVRQTNRSARRFYSRHGFAEKLRAGPQGAHILMVWPPERRSMP